MFQAVDKLSLLVLAAWLPLATSQGPTVNIFNGAGHAASVYADYGGQTTCNFRYILRCTDSDLCDTGITQTAQFQESKYFANVYSQDADIVYERCSLTGTTSAQCAQTTNPGPSEVVTSFSLAAPGGLSNYAPVPVTAGSASIIQTLTDCLAGITPASSTGTSSEPTSVGERPEDSPSNSGTEQSSSNNGGSSSSGGSGGLSTGAAVGLGVAVAAMSLGLATYAFFFYRSHFRHWRSMWARRKGGIVQSDKANHGEAGYGGQYGYGYERPPEQAELHHDPRPYELAQSGGTAGRSELGASISGPHELPGAAEFQAASELHGTSRK